MRLAKPAAAEHLCTVLSLGPQPSGWRDQVTAFIGRREFITLLGGAAVWPVAARAQQSERIRRIGALMDTAENNPEGQARFAVFRQTLRERNWVEGHSARIDT